MDSPQTAGRHATAQERSKAQINTTLIMSSEPYTWENKRYDT